MGCTLTYRLAAQGKQVTLLERVRLGHGASGVPVALLNPYRGRSARASPYDLEALAVMWPLVDELEALGLVTGVRRSGVLRIASNAKGAKTWQKREGVRWLWPEDIPDSYHAPFGGFLVPTGGWLEPALWLRALADAAEQKGATLIENCAVTQVTGGQPDGFELRTPRETFRADTVILTSGSDRTLGQRALELEQVAGEVIGLGPTEHLPYPLAGAVYGAQIDDTFFLGGNHRPANTPDESAPRQLKRAGGWFIPSLREASLASVWHGVRVKTGDNLPLVRTLQPGFLFVGALAGRGFLCAAKVAASVAEAL